MYDLASEIVRQAMPIQELRKGVPFTVQTGTVGRVEQSPQKAETEAPIQESMIAAISISLKANIAGLAANLPMLIAKEAGDEFVARVADKGANEADDERGTIRVRLGQSPTKASAVDEEVGDLEDRFVRAKTRF
jgi:hypothetical protein